MFTMNSPRPTSTVTSLAIGLAIVFCGTGTLLSGQEIARTEAAEAPKKKDNTPPAGAVEIRLVDDSVLKLMLRDERLELETSYGKLVVPVADIVRIDFGLRIPADDRKKIDLAIGKLGSANFQQRQAADMRGPRGRAVTPRVWTA